MAAQPVAPRVGTHEVLIERRPGEPVETFWSSERDEAERYARGMADQSFRVTLDGVLVPASDGTVNVLVHIPVKVNLSDWTTTYGQTHAEATIDIPEHVRAIAIEHARSGLAALGAGAVVTAPAI